MSRSITTSLEAEYEPSHDETDDRAVIGSTGCYISDKPVCIGSGKDDEMEF
ncbi:hypothetical protein [Halorussus pelagicus]|uniref:hypothetical protein n=1 Tax=Halorussus pelagicus TaxID=2505977 RepID=UPI00140A588A|nr:hypothetical protein [Halorussus pelagicus]